MKVTFKPSRPLKLNSYDYLRNRSFTPQFDRSGQSSEEPTRLNTGHYEVLRPTTMTMMFESSKPPTRDLKARSTPSTMIDHGQGTKYFINRITALERQQKVDNMNIEKLMAENSSLREDLSKMREINKELLKAKEGNSVSEIHHMYQDLFVTDMKRQIDTLSQEAMGYRFQSEACRRELEALKRDYGMMQSTLRRYRELVVAGSVGPRDNKDYLETASFISGLSSELDHLNSTGKSTDSNYLKVPKQSHNMRNKAISLQKAEELERALVSITKSRDIKVMCDEIAKAVRSVISCQRCTLFLLDRQISEMHAGSNETESKKLNMGKFWATFHIEQNQEVEEPIFSTLDQARKGIRTSSSLLFSVCHEARVLLSIQCSEKFSKKGKDRGFTAVDEVIVKILGHLTKSHLLRVISDHSAQKERDHTIEIVSIASELASSRTHQEFANQASKLLTGFFEFETAGVVFVDTYAEEFFMMAPAASGEGYSENVVRFPKTLGLSGEVFQNATVIQIDDVKKNVRYNPEIDNVAGSNELISLMVGVIPGPKNKRVGVLQLGNKISGQPLTPLDVQKFNSLAGLLGASITCTNDLVETMSLTINIKDCIEGILKAVETTDLARIDVESGQVLNLITSIKNQIVDWSRTKKQRFMSIFN